jgi:hypothetical protein
MDIRDSYELGGHLSHGAYSYGYRHEYDCACHVLTWFLTPAERCFTDVSRMELHNGDDMYVVTYNRLRRGSARYIWNCVSQMTRVRWWGIYRPGEVSAFCWRGRYSNTPPIFSRGW